mmetsp:Transcript_23960/g.30491  ORF Transcript_23960/g.30491 Transcript_23960/m.30491 type:complete len:90 (+) Transcript_23960:56-325(+)
MADSAIIEFIATGGNTPQLQRRKFKLNKTYDFSRVITFLRKQLLKSDQFDKSSAVYLFVNSTFQPHPEEKVGDLFDVGRDDKTTSLTNF